MSSTYRSPTVNSNQDAILDSWVRWNSLTRARMLCHYQITIPDHNYIYIRQDIRQIQIMKNPSLWNEEKTNKQQEDIYIYWGHIFRSRIWTPTQSAIKLIILISNRRILIISSVMISFRLSENLERFFSSNDQKCLFVSDFCLCKAVLHSTIKMGMIRISYPKWLLTGLEVKAWCPVWLLWDFYPFTFIFICTVIVTVLSSKSCI